MIFKHSSVFNILNPKYFNIFFFKDSKGLNCVISIDSKRINQDGQIFPKAVIYFNCIFHECKRYKLTIPTFKQKLVNITLLSTGNYNSVSHSNQKLCRNLSKKERERVADMLQKQSCSAYWRKEVNKICDDPVKRLKMQQGDLQSAFPLETLRKAKSEAKTNEDFAKDPIEDLQICFEKKLITSFSLPLNFQVISEQYLNILKDVKPDYIYFDATGSLMYKSNYILLNNNKTN